MLKPSTSIDCGVKHNKPDNKFKNDDSVRIQKYEIVFTKSYTEKWSGEVFVITKKSL